MLIEITTRHGELGEDQRGYLRGKAEKLQKYFARIMSIEVAAEPLKHGWSVEVLVSAEHKHDFVAKADADTPQGAMDACERKVEQQLRRYKEKVQNHHGAIPQGGTSPEHPDLPEPPQA